MGQTCGLICPDKFCMKACTRSHIDFSVNIPKVQATILENFRKTTEDYQNTHANGHKIAVIGAGPAGLSAAIYLKRAGASFLLLDKGAPGGKLNNIHEVANMPGFLPVSGYDLAVSLYKSVEANGVELTYGEVLSVKKEGDLFAVHTDVEDYLVKGIIVATGFVYQPLIPGEKELQNRGVSYCATCDGPLYRGQEVLVYGEGGRAEEEASYLSSICSKVYFLSKGEPDGKEIPPNVERLFHAEVLALKAENGEIAVKTRLSGTEKDLKVKAVFPLYGEKSALSFLGGLGVEEERGFIVVDDTMATSVDGLYAAGDIAKKGLRQVVTALGDGAVAGNALAAYLRRKKRG